MSGRDQFLGYRPRNAVATPRRSYVEATHAKGSADVRTLREGADPDNLIVSDGSQDPLASSLVSLALVLPSLAHDRDDPDALLIGMDSEGRHPVGQELGGRDDPEQLTHIQER